MRSGTSLWPVGVSCPGCVLSQDLPPPQRTGEGRMLERQPRSCGSTAQQQPNPMWIIQPLWLPAPSPALRGLQGGNELHLSQTPGSEARLKPSTLSGQFSVTYHWRRGKLKSLKAPPFTRSGSTLLWRRGPWLTARHAHTLCTCTIAFLLETRWKT